MSYIEVTGKNEDEAIAKALAQLKLDRDDVSVEILERSKAGFLGIGAVPAKVRVSYEGPEQSDWKVELSPEPVKETPVKAAPMAAPAPKNAPKAAEKAAPGVVF